MVRNLFGWLGSLSLLVALVPTAPALGQTLEVHLEFEGDVEDTASGLDCILWDGALGDYSYVEGPVGQALKLDHDPATLTTDFVDGAFIEVPYRLSQEGTIAFWYKVSPYYNYQSLWDNSGNPDDFEMWIYNTGVLRGRIDGNVGQVSHQLEASEKWYHIVYTWKRGDQAHVWVDGVERDTGSAIRAITDVGYDTAILGDSFYIGGGNAGNTFANGAFDDFRIYDGVLGATQIQALYELGSPPMDPGPNLLVRLEFEGDATDVSGNGLDGVIHVGALGGTSFIEGPSGQALRLEHDPATLTTDMTEGAFVEVPLTLPEAGSIVLWYRIDDVYNYQSIFDNSGSANDFEMWIYQDGILRGLIGADVGQVSHQLNDFKEWYHIAYTWKRGDEARLFIDGIERDVASGLRGITEEGFDLAVLGDRFYLGGGNEGNTFSNGAFDDVRIYDGPLTQAAVQAIKAEGDPPIDPEPDATLQILWDFEEGFEDDSGNDRHGELVAGILGDYSFVEGPVGTALKLDHDPLTLTSDTLDGAYVKVEYRLPAAGSILFWYRTEPYYNYQNLFNTIGNPDDFEMWIYNDGRLRARIDGDVGQVTHPLGLPNRWYHIAYTWSRGDRARLWVDGVERDTDSAIRLISEAQYDAAILGDTFYLGGGGGNTFANGAFDDFRLYEGRLSEEEIQGIFEEGDPPTVGPVEPVDPGPAAVHWPLDGNTENIGTLGIDFDGVLVEGDLGSPTYVPGKVGEGLSLDHGDLGTPMTGGSYVQVPNPLSDKGTIALWYSVRDYYNYQTIWDNSLAPNDWEMWVYQDGILRGRLGYTPASGVVSFDFDNLDGPNHWYHIAYTWDRDDLSAEAVKLYVNGELASAAAITNWVDPGDFFYLAGGNDGNTYGNGVWDDVRIYDKALTQAEVLFVLQGTTSCPDEGDTHAEELLVEGPTEGNVPGSYDAIAFANDDSGDKVFYTFTADDGASAPQVVGPQFSNLATFELTEGTWTVTVVVDDQPECDDQATDAVRSLEVTVSSGSGETVFHRGDANGDGDINITDGIFVLNYLFLGGPTPDCLEAANPNDDADINITDGIFILNYLFLGGPEPASPGPTSLPCGEDPADSASDLGCAAYTKC